LGGHAQKHRKEQQKEVVMEAKTSGKHKFFKDSGMTFKEVYDFAFKDSFIPIIKNLAKELKEDSFMEILKRAAYEAALQEGQNEAKDRPNNDFANFTAWARDSINFWKHFLTLDIVEDTDKAFEIKVTECLYAKTFRENDAGDIGYVTICHPDYAFCQGFNPKIKMIRTKTLMQGDDCCNHRWIWEE